MPVSALGALNSTVRTPQQTEIGLFWTEHTGQQYARAFRNLARLNALNTSDTARLFAMLWSGYADAVIGCWNAKFSFGFWRPVTAIRAGGGNPQLTGDPAWTPLAPTPAHPEYPAAHGCVTGAVSTILAGYFGTQEVQFSVDSLVTHTTHTFDSTNDLMKEVAAARVYAGFHYHHSVVEGRELGRKIVLIGHSMGGFVATYATAHEPKVYGAALISPGNLGPASARQRANDPEFWARWNENASRLVGTTAKQLVQEVDGDPVKWNYMNYVPFLKDRPIFVLEADDRNTSDNQAFAEALRKAGNRKVTEQHMLTDHAFSDHRIAMQVAIVNWLDAINSLRSASQRPKGTRTKVVLLGTGTPIPDPDRSGPATAIVVDDRAYLIDFGPGVVRRAESGHGQKTYCSVVLDVAPMLHAAWAPLCRAPEYAA